VKNSIKHVNIIPRGINLGGEKEATRNGNFPQFRPPNMGGGNVKGGRVRGTKIARNSCRGKRELGKSSYQG